MPDLKPHHLYYFATVDGGDSGRALGGSVERIAQLCADAYGARVGIHERKGGSAIAVKRPQYSDLKLREAGHVFTSPTERFEATERMELRATVQAFNGHDSGVGRLVRAYLILEGRLIATSERLDAAQRELKAAKLNARLADERAQHTQRRLDEVLVAGFNE